MHRNFEKNWTFEWEINLKLFTSNVFIQTFKKTAISLSKSIQFYRLKEYYLVTRTEILQAKSRSQLVPAELSSSWADKLQHCSCDWSGYRISKQNGNCNYWKQGGKWSKVISADAGGQGKEILTIIGSAKGCMKPTKHSKYSAANGLYSTERLEDTGVP